MTERFASHAGFEALHPDQAEYAQLLEAGRTAAGLEATRQFPCPGDLIITGHVGNRIELTCDTCQFEVTIPAGRERALASADSRIESSATADDGWAF